MYRVTGIRKAQLIQENQFLIYLYVVPMDAYLKENDRILIDAFKERYGHSVEIKLFHVDEVPYPRYGQKYKFAFSKIK